MRVIHNLPVNSINQFGVCVRALYFYHQDISNWLIQWLEMQKILGANKIFFYALAIHPNVKRILNFYQDEVNINIIFKINVVKD